MKKFKSKKTAITAILLASFLFCLAAITALPASDGTALAESPVFVSGGKPTKQDSVRSKTFSVTVTWKTTAKAFGSVGHSKCYFYALTESDAAIRNPTKNELSKYEQVGNKICGYFTESSSVLASLIRTASISFESTTPVSAVGLYLPANLVTGLSMPEGNITLTIDSQEIGVYSIIGKKGAEVERAVTLPEKLDTTELKDVPIYSIPIPAASGGVKTNDIKVFATSQYAHDLYDLCQVDCEIREIDSDARISLSGVSLSFADAVSGDATKGQKLVLSVTNDANKNTKLAFRLYVTVSYGAESKSVYSSIVTLERSSYTASFVTSIGTKPGDETVTYGASPTFPTLSANGYTFKGWSDIANSEVPVSAPAMTGDKIFYAIWQANTYSITLETDGGAISGERVVSYTYGVGATLPTDVVKEGFTFKGWYASRVGVDKMTAVSATDYGDKTFYAQYTEKAAVSIDVTAQNYVYDGTAQTFAIKGASSGLSGFKVLYSIGGFNVSTAKDAGNYTVTISRNEDASYKAYSKTIANGLVIEKADPTVNAVAGASTCYEGGDKPTLSRSAGDTAGTLAWDANQDWTAGTRNFAWTFTPTDKTNYNGATGTVSITVKVDVVTGISASFNQTGITVYSSVKDAATLKTLIAGGLTVTAAYESGKNAAVADYTLSYSALSGNANNTVTVNYADKRASFSNLYVTAVALKSISATLTQGNIEVYTSTAIENLKEIIAFGLDVKGLNNDGSAYNGGASIADYTLSFPDGVSGFVAGVNQSFVITYGGKSTTVNTLTITAVSLETIIIKTQPDKKRYSAFDTLDRTGMVVEANYNDGSKKSISNYTVKYPNGEDSFRVGHTAVNVKFAEAANSAGTTITGITVNKKSLAKPIVSGQYTYTGVMQTVRLDGFIEKHMTVSGNMRLSAGKQVATVSLSDTYNCEWSDKSVGALSIEWEISKVTLTPSVSGIAAKSYDGNTTAAGAISLAGAVNNESPTATATFVWTGANAGTTTVNVSNITLGGGWATNYELSATSLSNQSYSNAKINKVTLTPSVSGITAKIYDGNTTAAGAISLAGAVNNESPTATATFVWTGANAGTTTVNVSNITLGGGWATNYELSATSLSNQSYSNAKINKVTLTPSVSGIAAKSYDGNTTAAGAISLAGAVNNESPTATATFVWTGANAGTTTVNVSNITLGGGWATNYELSATSLSAKSYGESKISAATMTNEGAFADYVETYDKTAHGIGYDKDKIATVNNQPITVYFRDSETKPWAADVIMFTDFTDGAKTVYWKVSAPNHTDITGSKTVTIAKKAVTVTAVEKSSVHKSDLEVLTYTVNPALIAGDVFTGTLATNADKAVVGSYDITQGTLSAGDNYDVIFEGAKYSVVAKATVTITQTAQDFVYDKKAKVFVVKGTVLGGFTVEYLIKGAYTANAPVDAGSYKVKVSRGEDAQTYAFSTEITGGLLIATQKVAKPDENVSNFIYTGEEQIYALARDDRYSVSNAARTYAGEQTVFVALNDKSNYEWTGGGTGDLSFKFRIGKGAAEIGIVPTVIVKTYGDEWTLPQASSNFGTVECDKTVAQMRDTGRYTVTYRVLDTENYDGDVKSISVTVIKQKVDIPRPDTTVFVADGSQKTYAVDEDARYRVNGNIRTETGSYTVTVSLNDTENYEWSDGTTAELSYAFIVRKARLADKFDDNSEKENVIVIAEYGFAPAAAVEITVAEVETVPEVVAESEKVSSVYDVKLLLNGTPAKPDGPITIKFLIPADCVGVQFRLLNIHDGETSEMSYSIDGDYAVVTTDTLSEFVFVVDNTGSVLWLIVILSVLLSAEVVLAALKLRKNGKKTVKTYSFAPLLLAVFIPTGQISAAAVLGALCVAGGVYDVYLYVYKKKKPQDCLLTDEAETMAAVDGGVKVIDDVTAVVDGKAQSVTAADGKDLTAAVVGRGEQMRGLKLKTITVDVRYRKSFTAKLIQSPDETKRYYGALKNAILSFRKTTSRVSQNYDSINFGRTKLLKFCVKGKTLYLYLALDPDAYAGTKYKTERAESKKYAAVPCLYKIKNDRRAKYAYDLIAELALKNGLVKEKERNESYYRPYETTEALVAKGLIKELITEAEAEERRGKTIGDESWVRRSAVAASEASIMRDEVAAALIAEKKHTAVTAKRERGIVNIDCIAAKYRDDEIVNLQSLKDRGLIGKKVNYYKVLARGKLDKPLTVEADEFSIDAVKMILLTGGKVIKLT